MLLKNQSALIRGIIKDKKDINKTPPLKKKTKTNNTAKKIIPIVQTGSIYSNNGKAHQVFLDDSK